MSQTSGAEEFDPATGEFRPIRRQGQIAPAPLNPSPRKPGGARPVDYTPRQSYRQVRSAASPAPGRSGLSESGERYGVFYEIFESAAMSRTGKIAEKISLVVIAVVFLLLMYEAITYRLAQ